MPAAPAAAACPHCGAEPGSTLACLACGALLEEPAGATPFARLGQPEVPDPDLAAAERSYLRLSRLLHPDFHGGAGAAALERANRATAALNEAWGLLCDEQARLEFLLERRAPGALESAKRLSPAFLGLAMELSEEAEAAAGRPDAARELADRVRREVDTRLAAVLRPEAWQAPDAARLAATLHELRTLRRVLRDLGDPA